MRIVKVSGCATATMTLGPEDETTYRRRPTNTFAFVYSKRPQVTSHLHYIVMPVLRKRHRGLTACFPWSRAEQVMDAIAGAGVRVRAAAGLRRRPRRRSGGGVGGARRRLRLRQQRRAPLPAALPEGRRAAAAGRGDGGRRPAVHTCRRRSVARRATAAGNFWSHSRGNACRAWIRPAKDRGFHVVGTVNGSERRGER